jgi:hypothetical protein
VEAQGLAKGRERAHLLERGRHLGERRRAWGPLEVRWRLWEGRTSHERAPQTCKGLTSGKGREGREE